MNDNDPSSPERGVIEIIESFAPGYQNALALFAVANSEILVIKMSLIAALTCSWSYVIIHAANTDKPTAMAAFVAATCAIGLWRLFKIEDRLECTKDNSQ
jgi:hypothetical protein